MLFGRKKELLKHDVIKELWAIQTVFCRDRVEVGNKMEKEYFKEVLSVKESGNKRREKIKFKA